MIQVSEDKVWNAALYLRISKDDRAKDESNSIKNQRELLLDFVGCNPDIHVKNIMVDDGFTGANFDRAAFQDMIGHIEDGLVDCVIVKDLSRLGRDHIETGKYIERYFTAKKIRFIAVNDRYDSLKNDTTNSINNLIIPVKNIINESFLEDISIKVKTQIETKRKNGELVSNFAVYGYVKKDKELIVDTYAADIVKGIFDFKIAGYNEAKIASMLNEKGILSPAEYKKATGVSYHTSFTMGEKAAWSANAIKRILVNRVYLGHLEQGKRTKASYRMKKYYYKPREEWSIHENAHEPVIDETTFNLVQELMAMDTKTAPGAGRLHMFSGIIRCGLCGEPMIVKTKTKESGNTYVNYFCHTHKKTGTCQYNNVSEMFLKTIVLTAIQEHLKILLSPDKAADNLPDNALHEDKRAAIDNTIEDNLRIIKDKNEYLMKSSEHFISGTISEREYQLFKKSFNEQIQTAEKNITALREELRQLGGGTCTAKQLEQFTEYRNITELDRNIVVRLIKSIVVNGNDDVIINFRYSNEAAPIKQVQLDLGVDI